MRIWLDFLRGKVRSRDVNFGFGGVWLWGYYFFGYLVKIYFFFFLDGRFVVLFSLIVWGLVSSGFYWVGCGLIMGEYMIRGVRIFYCFYKVLGLGFISILYIYIDF